MITIVFLLGSSIVVSFEKEKKRKKERLIFENFEFFFKKKLL